MKNQTKIFKSPIEKVLMFETNMFWKSVKPEKLLKQQFGWFATTFSKSFHQILKSFE